MLERASPLLIHSQIGMVYCLISDLQFILAKTYIVSFVAA